MIQGRLLSGAGVLHSSNRIRRTEGEHYRWVEVAPPDGQTGIVLAMPQSDGERASIGQQGFIFFCDDVRQTYDELTARGVSFHTAPTTEFWGTFAQFKDHQGNEFLLSERSGLRSA